MVIHLGKGAQDAHWAQSLIEGRAAELWKVKKSPLSRYIPLYRAATLLGIEERQLISMMHGHPTLHAIVYHEQYLVHPDEVFRMIRKKMKRLISQTVKSQNASFLQEIRSRGRIVQPESVEEPEI